MVWKAGRTTAYLAGWCVAAGLAIGLCGPVHASQITPFTQAVAEAALEDGALSGFYRDTGYDALWTGDSDLHRARRAALLAAVGSAGMHGLPAGRYDERDLRALMAGARTARDRGRVEVALSRALLSFAGDLRSGVLTPGDVIGGIKRVPEIRGEADLLRDFARATPGAFFAALRPETPEYTRLIRAKLGLERAISAGGWGAPLTATALEPGAGGAGVVALRDRLMAMGYLGRSASARYEAALADAVRRFQSDHGLEPDGVAGPATIAEINVGPAERLGQILVAMERERWLTRDLGDRHVWVNLTDFSARIVQDGEVAFQTRSVIGKDVPDHETPEFSDVMEFMVVNPSWYVPRSIVVNEYLPILKRNPRALGHLEITDRRGRKVRRSGFSRYTARTFPFAMRQPPGPRNALGRVKFMFPNKYNIYLHDTPAKNLFSRNVRAFSHGCIRLNDPFEFAHAMLSVQQDDPEEYFQRLLRTGREARVTLEAPVPVHIVYRTAFTKPEGGMEYRRDVYGRDARILAALRRAGVALPGPQS